MDGIESAHWKKLPPGADFTDISDYARPVAHRVVAFLQHRPVSVLDVTTSFLVAGLLAAACMVQGSYPGLLVAIVLIQVKNLLDAVDGSLARARKTPSRLGRFYDSFCDFLVGAALFASLGYLLARAIGPMAAVIALAAFVSALLQNSLYCYHTVAHRLRQAGIPSAGSTSDRALMKTGTGGYAICCAPMSLFMHGRMRWPREVTAALRRAGGPGPS